MKYHLSIRIRLTAISVLLLSVCCVGLTLILNLSATHMVDHIEATPIYPASEVKLTALTPSKPISQHTMNLETKEARNKFQYKSILYMALVIMSGGILTYIMTGKTIEPLQELSRQMKNRTVHNLSEELIVPKHLDEIGLLTVSFNQMSQKLKESFAMQKRFSQSAAHELRTPLTVLKTKVDVFKKKKEHTPLEYDNLLTVITNQTNRLSDLVKDLLDLANMDDLDCSDSIDLYSLLTEIQYELSSIAEDKNIVITITESKTTVTGNKRLLHRAFYNIIENSIKYNQEEGHVFIKIAQDVYHGIVTISDSGIGIQASNQPFIFEPFYRVDKSRSRQMGGAGLGLATVKTIIDKHNGSIEVGSNIEGGTDFTVFLKH